MTVVQNKKVDRDIWWKVSLYPYPLPWRATTVTIYWGILPAISPRACLWPSGNRGIACFPDPLTQQLNDVIKTCCFVLFLLFPYLFLLGSASSNSQAPFSFLGSHGNRKVHGQNLHIYVVSIFTCGEDCADSPRLHFSRTRIAAHVHVLN